MPRLVFINRYFHPDPSATSRMLTDLALHLGRTREVLVLCSRQLLEEPAARLARSGRVGPVGIRRLASTAFGRHWLPGRMLDYLSFLASVFFWLLANARRDDRVIAMTDPPLLGVAVSVAAALRRFRVVHWLQDLYPEVAGALGVGSRHSLLSRVLQGLRNTSVRRAALTVAISPRMAADLRAQCPAGTIACIPNWADEHATAAAHEPHPREPGRLAVGYSGNLGRAHPVAGLAAAIGRLRSEPRIGFTITGGGAHVGVLQALLAREGSGHCSFLPYERREDLGARLRASDVHLVLLDRRAEGLIFPSKVYGILAAGRPILFLGDPRGEVGALLAEHRCGWSLPDDDPAAIAGELERLRAAPDEVAQAGIRARQAHERHFTARVALSQWEQALDAVGAPAAQHSGAPLR